MLITMSVLRKLKPHIDILLARNNSLCVDDDSLSRNSLIYSITFILVYRNQ